MPEAPGGTSGAELRPLLPTHWTSVREIYRDGIATGHATFEVEPPDWEQWDATHLPHSRFVAVHGDRISGWSALSPVSGRCVYAGVAEVSVYVASWARGRGVGRQLLRRLVESATAEGLWTLQAGIFPENRASLAIHAAEGFREVGRRERIGRLHGVWRDVVLMERRSGTVGIV